MVQCTKIYEGAAAGDRNREQNIEPQTKNPAHMISPGCAADIWLTPVHGSSHTHTTVWE